MFEMLTGGPFRITVMEECIFTALSSVVFLCHVNLFQLTRSQKFKLCVAIFFSVSPYMDLAERQLTAIL